MKNIKYACLALWLVGVFGCSSTDKADVAALSSQNEADEKVVVLENLTTRVVAYCYDKAPFSAEECAREMEQKGYVRLTDKPKFTADREVLTTGEYPTRRWRETDRIPRW